MRVPINVLLALLIVAGISVFYGCTSENPVAGDPPSLSAAGEGAIVTEITDGQPEPPPGLVQIDGAGESLQFWPYTGTDFSGIPQDPINLVFVGQVEPAEVRAALLALDGNRPSSQWGPPFNMTWSDALGNVQTSYSEGGDGWVGNVIQLQLGTYDTGRIHLRLFKTGKSLNAGGGWTVANAHFDLLIPGTADHQVISWEKAEEIVREDLERTGLLGEDPSSTGVINQEPSFRDIPVPIYNGLPDGLKVIVGLPPGPVTDPVPIPNDGEATLLYVTGSTPVLPDIKTEISTIAFGQLVPRPFCSRGPLDFVWVEGPLSLRKVVQVEESGRYQYRSSISGHLVATPMDVTQNPPVPIGEPFKAIISDEQRGRIDVHGARVTFASKRIAPQEGGTEKLIVDLKVSTRGETSFRSLTQCLAE